MAVPKNVAAAFLATKTSKTVCSIPCIQTARNPDLIQTAQYNTYHKLYVVDLRDTKFLYMSYHVASVRRAATLVFSTLDEKS